FKLKFGKVYDGMLPTPMKPMDIAVGEIIWCLFRGFLYAAAFLVIALVMGLVRGWMWILALPACVLIGFAFAACGFAATTWMKSWQRSEEHTSELQSRENLVCRLLLEKKK